MKDKIFVDSDIILDMLGKRLPFHVAADKLFTMSERQDITLKTSSLVFSNLHYLLSKQLGSRVARETLKRLRPLVDILSADDRIIDAALASDFKDFEMPFSTLRRWLTTAKFY